MYRVKASHLSAQQSPRLRRRNAIQVVCISKGADAFTTAVGLLFLPLMEANPMARWLMAEVGVLQGIVVASVASIAIVVTVTETGVIGVRSLFGSRGYGRSIRLLGYGSVSVIWILVALHNAVLIVTTL